MANLKPMKLENPMQATEERISYKTCKHNELIFKSCYKYVDFITNIMIKEINNINDYKYITHLDINHIEFMWCQQCISVFLSHSMFINRFNKYIKMVLIFIQKGSELFYENIHGFQVFVGILISFLNYPKILKLIFKKYWKVFFEIFYFLLKLIDKSGTKLFGDINATKPELKSITCDMHIVQMFAEGLCMVINDMILYFTPKQWKFVFVEYQLLYFLCNVAYFKYIYIQCLYPNLDESHVLDWDGKIVDRCVYMELFYIASGCKFFFENDRYCDPLRVFMESGGFVMHIEPESSQLYTLLNNTFLSTSMQLKTHHKFKRDWFNAHKHINQLQECHCPKCTKIQVFEKNIPFKKCANCRVVVYCSKKCQKYDWARGGHRSQCNKLKDFRLKACVHLTFKKKFNQ